MSPKGCHELLPPRSLLQLQPSSPFSQCCSPICDESCPFMECPGWHCNLMCSPLSLIYLWTSQGQGQVQQLGGGYSLPREEGNLWAFINLKCISYRGRASITQAITSKAHRTSEVTGMREACRRSGRLWCGHLLPGGEAGPVSQVFPVLGSLTPSLDSISGCSVLKCFVVCALCMRSL